MLSGTNSASGVELRVRSAGDSTSSGVLIGTNARQLSTDGRIRVVYGTVLKGILS